jgi:hypothetical protein
MSQYDIGPLPALAKHDELFLFIGAGLSIGAGLPGWVPMVEELTKDLDFNLPQIGSHIRASHLLEGIEFYVDRFGFNTLIRRMRQMLDTTAISPTKIHTLITELPIKEIYTTNYDNLIEKAYASQGMRFNKIVRDQEIPYWDHQAYQIVKICGELEQPDSMIVTQTQFNSFSSRRPHLIMHLKTTMVSRTPLFLGYSLRDPFLNQIWDTISYEFGVHRRRGYAALFDCKAAMRKYFDKRGIEVINLDIIPGQDPNEKLTNWLSEFLNATR